MKDGWIMEGRAAGALFGLAYGDHLGKATEFMPFEAIVARYGPRGPRQLTGRPALVTDDTQMALAVGWALRDAPDPTPSALTPPLRERFVAWAHETDAGRAPGNTCLRACANLVDPGTRWQEATVAGSKGCGANMRVAPVGLIPGLPLDALAGIAQLQAALTHGHPTGLAASELTGYAVRLLRDGTDLASLPGLLRDRCADQRGVYRDDWLGDLWRVAGADDPVRFIAAGWDECAAVLDRLATALIRPDRDADPCLATGAGWIAEEALATGLYCALLFPDDPVAALGRAAASSGDSDSIACLAGAFLGARGGFGIWPAEWADQIEYADQLAALARVP
ncbi:ADP-ribosylglycohydrolase family protein [Actinomycetes bacterium KLBMP 9797]